MGEGSITKTVWQYSKPLPQETVQALLSIARDYTKVKKYVYGRYGGIHSLEKLSPGYEILNEMRTCGLRQQLGLPVVYYELAIFDAIRDIKAAWSSQKNKISQCVNKNKNLSIDDKIYIHTVLKMDSVYCAVLQRRSYEMPRNAQGCNVDKNRLNNLICRLTRRYKSVLDSSADQMFRVSPAGYSYCDGGIKFAGRIPRKRIFVPLRDSICYKRQITVEIKQNAVELAIPVDTKIKSHEDYVNSIYISIGYHHMFTLSNGNVYGETLSQLISPETDRISQKNRERYKMYKIYAQRVTGGELGRANKIKCNNLGKKKYNAQKERGQGAAETYINTEMNRMLREEKPYKIVIIKNTKDLKGKSRNFFGYIRSRLEFKCKLNSIELVQVNPFKIRDVCSNCGCEGKSKNGEFICKSCKLRISTALNAAKNIEKIYLSKG